MRRRRRTAGGHGDEDVPWASFADALTGLLFVFILLALSFAHQLQEEMSKAEKESAKIMEANLEAQAELERQLRKARRARKIARDLVRMDRSAEKRFFSVALCLETEFPKSGDFRLQPNPTVEEARLSLYLDRPGETLSTVRWFKIGGASLEGEPCEVARAIGPCLEQALEHPGLWDARDDFLLRVFVEGHTDNWPVMDGPFLTNWELSGARAAAVVRAFLVPRQAAREADKCGAVRNVSSLQTSIDEERLDVVSVGLAERKPAWKPLCPDDCVDPVCQCLRMTERNQGNCGELLKADSLIQWANGNSPAPSPDDPRSPSGGDPNEDDGPKDERCRLQLHQRAKDARRQLQRRVDLRFEVTPRRFASMSEIDG